MRVCGCLRVWTRVGVCRDVCARVSVCARVDAGVRVPDFSDFWGIVSPTHTRSHKCTHAFTTTWPPPPAIQTTPAELSVCACMPRYSRDQCGPGKPRAQRGERVRTTRSSFNYVRVGDPRRHHRRALPTRLPHARAHTRLQHADGRVAVVCVCVCMCMCARGWFPERLQRGQPTRF